MTVTDPAPATGDAGTTLIEILMAVMLVGISFVALLAGFGTVALGSDIHRKMADAEVVLTSAAERLKDPEVLHVPCADEDTPSADTYLAAVRSAAVPSSGWDPATITISEIQYAYTEPGTPGMQYGPTCFDTDATEHLLPLQEITIEVTSPDGRATESITMVKGPAKVATP